MKYRNLFLFGLFSSALFAGEIDSSPSITVRVWTSGGVVSVGRTTDTLTGVRTALGAEVQPVESRFLMGMYFSKLLLTENFPTSEAIYAVAGSTAIGKFATFNILVTGGYYLIPDTLFIRLAQGLAWASSDTSVASRSLMILGAGFGYNIKLSSQWKLGLEGMYEYRGGNSLYLAFSELNGSFPKAHLFSLNVVISFMAVHPHL